MLGDRIMGILETKDELRAKIKDEYVTIRNFTKKKKLPYDSFRIWLHNNCRTRDERKLNAIAEFGKEMIETLENENLKRRSDLE